jgi:hypothetical protein
MYRAIATGHGVRVTPDNGAQFIDVWQPPVVIAAQHQLFAIPQCILLPNSGVIGGIGIFLRILPGEVCRRIVPA